MCEYFNRGLLSDLSQQRRGGSAEVVGDEQLGVRVDPCWVELPQWLETVIQLDHYKGSFWRIEHACRGPAYHSC